MRQEPAAPFVSIVSGSVMAGRTAASWRLFNPPLHLAQNAKSTHPKAALIRVQKQLTEAEPPRQNEGSRGNEHWSTQAMREPAAGPPQCKHSAHDKSLTVVVHRPNAR